MRTLGGSSAGLGRSKYVFDRSLRYVELLQIQRMIENDNKTHFDEDRLKGSNFLTQYKLN